MPMPLLDLRAVVARDKKVSPLWRGPCAEGPHGGVTQSLLGRFLACRERFRIYAIEGLRTVDRWNHRTGFGDLHHVCEEALAKGVDWRGPLEAHCRQQLTKYPFQRQEIEHWYMVCTKQFPEYVKFWQTHRDIVARTPLLSEQVFDVPYYIPYPSGRVVRLRGKWDSVDLINEGPNKGVWLMENKTKSNPDEVQIKRQLRRDMQAMLYLSALHLSSDTCSASSIRGVRYNVIRRPLSGGKGTIVQKQPTNGTKCTRCKGLGAVVAKRGSDSHVTCPKCGGIGRVNPQLGETRDEYYERCAKYIRDEPHEFFMRWEVEVSAGDVQRFRRQVLDPLLQQLCDWYDWVTSPEGVKDPFANPCHFVYPYGIFNSVLEDRTGDYDAYLDLGSTIGLVKVDGLFKELA